MPHASPKPATTAVIEGVSVPTCVAAGTAAFPWWPPCTPSAGDDDSRRLRYRRPQSNEVTIKRLDRAAHKPRTEPILGTVFRSATDRLIAREALAMGLQMGECARFRGAAGPRGVRDDRPVLVTHGRGPGFRSALEHVVGPQRQTRQSLLAPTMTSSVSQSILRGGQTCRQREGSNPHRHVRRHALNLAISVMGSPGEWCWLVSIYRC
jgi:hypothetical protein